MHKKYCQTNKSNFVTYSSQIVYGSARKSYLCILDPVQNQALRLCLGAFRTSPVSSLHVEANEIPLDIRRRRLASQYCFKVSSDVTNPARSCIFNKSFSKLFAKRPKQIRPLGFRVGSDLGEIGFRHKTSARLGSSCPTLALHFTFSRFLSTCI